nr:PREDICTED: rho GTPase-activating protein 25 [Latimeria chalumnae]|eukprot:XP_006009714.1 PREDICTED: rho GTPase-activating protein 25 [Latimeria chalumnae]
MSLKLPRTWDFNLKTDAGKIARSKSVMTGDPTGTSNRPASPSSLERPLKTGWLKKQRSIVKNWQHRYFVLKGQQLLYYKDEEEGKPQGCIFLPGCQVQELASNPEEPGKFLFEIVPGISGDRDRIGQDTYVLMANSQNEMEEWVKSLRRVMGASSSGVVFGQRLADTVAYEQKYGQHLVPILVEKCAEFIREHGLNEEGIFRLPGQDNQVKQLRDAFDAGERPSFDCETDVHTVASLFKLYLRELPEPVIPWSQYEDFLSCAQLTNTDEEAGYQELVKQVALLPRVNYNLLSYICSFLYEIQLNSNVNKMSVENLATVIGVNLLKPKIEDPVAIMRGTHQIQKLMTIMISNHEGLLPKSKDVPPSPPSQKSDSKKAPIPRSSVGWDAAEDTSVSKKEEPNFSSLPCSGLKNSVENIDKISSDKLELWAESPRKRTQTLPSRRPSIISNKAISDKLDIFSNEFWSSSPGAETNSASTNLSSASEGHKRTLSQDFFKFLDTPRTSTYGNVLPSTTSPTLTDNKTGQSLKSSSPRTGSGVADLATDVTEKTEKDSVAKNPSHLMKVIQSVQQGNETEEVSKENTSSLQNLVIELKREMEHQQNTYEQKIKSLEKDNYDIRAKVINLKKELEKEKKKNDALGIQLRNVQQAFEDAEKRNKALEKDIKDFIGSLNQSTTSDKQLI